MQLQSLHFLYHKFISHPSSVCADDFHEWLFFHVKHWMRHRCILAACHDKYVLFYSTISNKRWNLFRILYLSQVLSSLYNFSVPRCAFLFPRPFDVRFLVTRIDKCPPREAEYQYKLTCLVSHLLFMFWPLGIYLTFLKSQLYI